MQEQHPVAQPQAVAPGLTGVVRTATNGDIERFDGTSWVKVNAFDAVKLAVSRSFGISGDVTGATTSDWSDNLTIATTVASESHRHGLRPAFIMGGGGFVVGSGGWAGLSCSWLPWDPYGCRSGDSAVLRIPGWWYVGANVWFADNVTGQRLLGLWGMDANSNFEIRGASDGAGRWSRSTHAIQYSDGGRSTQTVVWQSSGVNLTVNEWTHFGVWMCP